MGLPEDERKFSFYFGSVFHSEPLGCLSPSMVSPLWLTFLPFQLCNFQAFLHQTEFISFSSACAISASQKCLPHRQCFQTDNLTKFSCKVQIFGTNHLRIFLPAVNIGSCENMKTRLLIWFQDKFSSGFVFWFFKPQFCKQLPPLLCLLCHSLLIFWSISCDPSVRNRSSNKLFPRKIHWKSFLHFF